MTLLAGLALFVLKNVFKKIEELDKDQRDMLNKMANHAERLTKVETKIEICPSCGSHKQYNGRLG
jgi:NADH pyrophosphatase NudC (nudix superfamily)